MVNPLSARQPHHDDLVLGTRSRAHRPSVSHISGGGGAEPFLRSGADFIGVGMFDFQIQQNCELAAQAVRRAKERPRPWRA